MQVFRCDELAVVVPPGRHLAEKLEEMGLDANDLAARMGYTPILAPWLKLYLC